MPLKVSAPKVSWTIASRFLSFLADSTDMASNKKGMFYSVLFLVHNFFYKK